MVSVRPAELDDILAISRIYVESWNAGFGDLLGHRVDDDERRARWADDLVDPIVDWFVAEAGETVIGFAGVGASRDPVDPALGELHTIAVDPPYWRTGIGHLLMDRALDQLRREFAGAIVWTPAGYDAGHAFYVATGWYPLGAQRRSGGEVAFGHDLSAPIG